jgi:tripartite-type tricarboxylate transporter receptor subunit TctC
MKLSRRKFLRLAAGATALPAISRVAFGQVYPARPITMIVPFAAGGPNDRIGRIMAERMSVSLGQPVAIANIDGAAGSIGTGRAARAAPDGYTISIGYWGAHVANAAIYALDYDVATDFEPISLLVESPLLVAARKATPASDLKEFVSWLRANPDKASAAVPGSASHIASVFFQRETGTRFRLVPYRGAGPAIQDSSQGRIDMALLNAGAPLPHVRSGEFKAYAVSAKRRLAAAPDIPTVEEAGFPNLDATVWFGFWAPAHTPKTSSPGSMLPPWRLWPARASGHDWPIWRRRYFRASSRPRWRSPHCRRPRSRNGGRSSKKPASSRSESCHGSGRSKPRTEGAAAGRGAAPQLNAAASCLACSASTSGASLTLAGGLSATPALRGMTWTCRWNTTWPPAGSLNC